MPSKGDGARGDVQDSPPIHGFQPEKQTPGCHFRMPSIATGLHSFWSWKTIFYLGDRGGRFGERSEGQLTWSQASNTPSISFAHRKGCAHHSFLALCPFFLSSLLWPDLEGTRPGSNQSCPGPVHWAQVSYGGILGSLLCPRGSNDQGQCMKTLLSGKTVAPGQIE